MYKSIHLNSAELKIYKTSSGNSELENLSKINIFIGPNNTGKSKFLRGLFSNSNPEFKIESINLEVFNAAILNLKTEIEDYFMEISVESVGGVFLNKLVPINYITNGNDAFNNLYKVVETLSKTDIDSITPIVRNRSISGRLIKEFINDAAIKCLSEIDPIQSIDETQLKRDRIYIPTLRGLRGIAFNSEKKIIVGDNYLIRTQLDYFINIVNINDENQIYTGLSLYEDVKRLLLGSSPDRSKIKRFEKFISDTFFDKKGFTIIPHIDDNVVHVKIGEEEDFPIYKLGEGIQSIIILTYPLFINQGKNMNVHIEEPDLFLHPGFQRILIETFLRPEFNTFQFYITTHSNHFLDMTLDFDLISVYAFSKNSNKEFEIENVKNDDTNLLEILGVKNSSVFLSNCTIWVEGITDRIYIRKYLELYQKAKVKIFHEDIHYSFVEYGGGNITHWSFLDDQDENHPNIVVEKLCGKLFLITDKDGVVLKQNGEKSKKLLRQEKLKEKLGDHYYCLESREIENLLTSNVIENVIKEFENGDLSFMDFSKLKIDSYKDQPLGKFIEEKVKGIVRSYKAESGTIKDKVEFAKKSVTYMGNFDDLSEEAKVVTEKIYNFIKENNS